MLPMFSLAAMRLIFICESFKEDRQVVWEGACLTALRGKVEAPVSLGPSHQEDRMSLPCIKDYLQGKGARQIFKQTFM